MNESPFSWWLKWFRFWLNSLHHVDIIFLNKMLLFFFFVSAVLRSCWDVKFFFIQFLFAALELNYKLGSWEIFMFLFLRYRKMLKYLTHEKKWLGNTKNVHMLWLFGSFAMSATSSSYIIGMKWMLRLRNEIKYFNFSFFWLNMLGLTCAKIKRSLSALEIEVYNYNFFLLHIVALLLTKRWTYYKKWRQRNN